MTMKYGTGTSLDTPMLRAGLGRFIAVASGKGGVGRTWLSITLAQAMARMGRRVLLFDADFGLANIDIQLGLGPAHDIGAVLAGQARMANAVTWFEPGGFDVIAGRSGSGALASLAMPMVDGLLASLADVGRHYDTVLLDLGGGLHPQMRRVSAWADTMLAVVTEDPASITDAYATLKLHAADRPGGDARVVVNQASTLTAGLRTAATLTQACKVFLKTTPEFCGTIRRDPCVQDAIRRQTPLLVRHPNSPAGMDVERVAQQLLTAENDPQSSEFPVPVHMS